MAHGQRGGTVPADDEGPPREAPILVPVDLSRHAEAALAFAADLAERYAAPLLVLHVVHDPAGAPGFYKSLIERSGVDVPLVTLDKAAAAAFDAWLVEVRSRHPDAAALATAETRLVVGVPAGRILEVAAAEGARMIVMGSLGRTGLPHLLLGSKALRVAQLSPIPVTIVKAPPEPKE